MDLTSFIIGLILGILILSVGYLLYKEHIRGKMSNFDYDFIPIEKEHFTCDICESEFDTEVLGDTVMCPECKHKMSVVI